MSMAFRTETDGPFDVAVELVRIQMGVADILDGTQSGPNAQLARIQRLLTCSPNNACLVYQCPRCAARARARGYIN